MGYQIVSNKKLIQQINFLIDPASRVAELQPGMIVAEIRLNPDHKVSVCHELNKLVKQLKGQVILAVLDDEQDRYVRLIGKGLNANETNVDDFGKTRH